ncbi:MAG: hypothetical protein ABEH43_09460 [Flavobacteriales bacterium]
MFVQTTGMYLVSVIGLYILLLLGYYVLSKQRPISSFKTKNSWLINGLSLFIVHFSVTTPLLYSGLFHNEGVGGLWLLWCGYPISGFVPFVFAPLWAKLDFITDNQLILYRFTGKPAKILHQFRAVYVGFLVVAFLLSFQVLALIKSLEFFTHFSENSIYLILSAILIFIAFKNNLNMNLKLDVFHSILIFTVISLALVFFYINSNGWYESVNTIHNTDPQTLNIFPKNTSYLFILFTVHTWSVMLFDGSGVDAQRFFSTDNKNKAWLPASSSVAYNFIFTFLLLSVLMLGKASFDTTTLEDKEKMILHYMNAGTPQWLHPFILIAIFAIFLTSFEGLINWGVSFLTVDLYKTYIMPKSDHNKQRQVSVLAMVSITAFSIILAYFNDSLESIIKAFFSITAGVAPVFLLRWFWMRINAWSQLSAMIASLIYAMFYTFIISNTPFENQICDFLALNTYSLKLLFITFLTCITWLIFTFSTPPDDAQRLKEFRSEVLEKADLKKGFVKAVLFGVGVTFLLVLILYIML